MNRILFFVTILISSMLMSASAFAWDSASLWYDPAEGAKATPYDIMPGGGGVLATGGQSDFAITCANCHIKGATGYGAIGLTITPALPTMYKPGMKYDFTVKMTGEHLGMGMCDQYVLGNINQFAMTFEDAAGKPVGTLSTDYGTSSACPKAAPDPKTFKGSTYLYSDCRAVISTPEPNRTSWTFSWTAPTKGSGGITAFWGAVDGDCMMDSKMDDVVVGNGQMGEGLASYVAPRPHLGPGSNPALGNGMAPWSLAFAPLVGAIIAWRRKRK